MFEVERKVLLDACAAVFPAVSKKNVMPVYQCFKIRYDAGEDRLHIAGSDLEQWAGATIPVNPQTANLNLCVNASTFLQVLRLLTTKTLKIDNNGNIVAGKIKQKLPVQDGSSFSEPPDQSEAEVAEYNKSELLHALQEASYAANDNDVSVSGAVVISATDKCVSSTSGKLGATCELVPSRFDGAEKTEALVPKGYVNSILMAIKESDSDLVIVYYSQNGILFKSCNRSFYCRQIFGRPESTQKFLRRKFPLEVFCDREELLGCVRQSLLSLTEDVVRAKLTFADNVIKVEAKSPNGTFSGEVVCKYEGEPFARDYWAAKLVQVLKQIGAENIRISSVTGEHGALIINDSSKSPPRSIHAIMSMS